jgi:terminase large subunit-like protein
MTTVAKRYLLEKADDRCVVTMTIDDAKHYDDAARAQIIAQYPEHERDARLKGVPAMGSGRVFPVDENQSVIDPIRNEDCPQHWIRVGGMDLGYDHPSAFCELWWDRDVDVLYVARTLRIRQASINQLARMVRDWGLVWAWPQDGRQETLAGAGEPIMQQFRAAGLQTMPEHAQFEGGSRSVEAGVAELLDRMKGQRLKIFRGQNEALLEEIRMYHRKDGLLVKHGDDAISALRYGMMMLRYGRSNHGVWKMRQPWKAPPLGIV